MRVAIYARVSTEEQAEKFGLAAQITELGAYAAKRGWAIPTAAQFVDDGYSGAELERPALNRLREAIRLGIVDVVLIHDMDRLSRRLLHQLLLLEECKRARVQVEFLLTPRDDTPEGQFRANILGAVAELERERIRDRTARGKREKARRGLVVASYPYGYRPDPAAPGRLVVYEPEAQVVRLIYALLVDEQKSGRAIVGELRRLGISPCRGRQWGLTQVRRILNSDRYAVGRVYYNRGAVVAAAEPGHKTRRIERPSNEWIAISIPSLVTPERFAAAQAQLARNRQRLVGRPAQFTYLLRGLLRCDSCGQRYVSTPSHGIRYYRCYGRNSLAERRCRSPWLSASAAETVVWTAITRALRQPKVLLRALEGYATRQGVRDVELRSGLEHLRRQMIEVERQEHKLLDLYLDETLRTDALRARLTDLARRREGLRERLTRAEAQTAAHSATEARQDAIAQWCAQARRGLRRLDQRGRQRLLATLVDEIRVLPSRTLEIHGILPPRSADMELRQPA